MSRNIHRKDGKMSDTQLIPQQTIFDMVESYEKAVILYAQAEDLLKQSADLVHITTGNKYFSPTISVSYHNHYGKAEPAIRQACWKNVIDLSGARHIMSPSKKRELDNWLEKSEGLPPFTVENIQAQFAGLNQNAFTMFEDYAKEVFEFLRPWQNDRYKTNQKNRVMITGKVIIECGLSYGRLNSGKEDFFTALDNLFHILDKKPVPKEYEFTFKGLLNQAINNACAGWSDVSSGEMSTEYFRVKWFRKGTIHLEFLRPDLVEDFNRWSGNHSELPATG